MTDQAASKRTVYAVTSGHYSDYEVNCIFERREDAERYVAAGMGWDVEEMTLYSDMPALYTVYAATVHKVGGPWGQPGQLGLVDHRSTDEPKHEPYETDWAFKAEGPDRERVIKSVRDRYAAWKAKQEGVA